MLRAGQTRKSTANGGIFGRAARDAATRDAATARAGEPSTEKNVPEKTDHGTTGTRKLEVADAVEVTADRPGGAEVKATSGRHPEGACTTPDTSDRTFKYP